MKKFVTIAMIGTASLFAAGLMGCVSGEAEAEQFADTFDSTGTNSASSASQGAATTDDSGGATNSGDTSTSNSGTGDSGNTDSGNNQQNNSQGGGSNGSTVRGDQNGDSLINDSDLRALSRAFGTTNTSADMNGDGRVDIQDLALLLTLVK